MEGTNDSRARQRRRLEASSFLYAVRPIIIDLASTLLFYGLLALTGDPRISAIGSIALAMAQMVWMKVRGSTIAPLQLASTLMVVVFGGLTIVTHDPRFVLVKVTIFYAAFGATMLRSGWMARYIPRIAEGHIPGTMVVPFERAWAGLMLFTGALNLTLAVGTNGLTTAQIMMPVAIGSKVALFLGQYVLFRRIARPRIKVALERSTI